MHACTHMAYTHRRDAWRPGAGRTATSRKPRQSHARFGGSPSRTSKTPVLHQHRCTRNQLRCTQGPLRCGEGHGRHRSGGETCSFWGKSGREVYSRPLPVVLGVVVGGGVLGGVDWEPLLTPLGQILWVRQVAGSHAGCHRGYHRECGSTPSGACVWGSRWACCLLQIQSFFRDGGVSSSLVTEVSHLAL